VKKNYVIATIIGITLLIPSIYFYFREDRLPSCELGSSVSSVHKYMKENGMTLVAKRRKVEETYSSPKETVKVYYFQKRVSVVEILPKYRDNREKEAMFLNSYWNLIREYGLPSFEYEFSSIWFDEELKKSIVISIEPVFSIKKISLQEQR